MSWSDTFLTAQFRGIEFDVLQTDDAAQRATVEHAYPYRDGAAVEDLGRGARHIQCEAIFYGDDYERRLQAFVHTLDIAGEGDLQHPVFGILWAQLASYRIHHEAEHVDQARVSLEFIESLPDQGFFDHSLATQKVSAIAAAAVAAQAAAAESLGKRIDALKKASPLATLPTLRATLMGAFNSIMASARGWVASGLDVLAEPRAWAADIAGAAGSVLDLWDFVSTQPGQLLNDWRSAATLLGALLPVGGQSMGRMDGATPTEAQAVDAAQIALSVTQATTLATAAQLLLESEATTASLSPADIEEVADTLRTLIDDVLAQVRAVYPLETARTLAEPLKDLARAVQVAAAAIIEARPPMLERQVESPACLRLLAHRWYGDHTRAPELLRLNPMRAPNFIQTGDALHAYAG